MKEESLLTQAANHGDFYLHYRRFDNQGLTYLVGTLEFDNPYILKRLTDHKDPCGLPFALLKKMRTADSPAAKLALLEKQVKSVKAKASVLVYSWSSDRFRMIPCHSVTKMQGLASVLRNEY